MQSSSESSSDEFMIVLASATEGRVAELTRWYDEVHIPELLERFPDVVAAERLDAGARTVFGEGATASGADSIAVYRVRGSARSLWAEIRQAGLARSDALDYRTVTALFAGA